MPKPKNSFYVTAILITCFIVFIIIVRIKLKDDGVLLNAKTTKWVMGANMNMSLEYEFYYQKKKILATNAFGRIRGNNDFVEHYFPVMYYPELGGHSQLLVQPSDFDKYKINFPDSLRWVIPYFDN